MLPSEGYVTTEDGIRLYYHAVGSGPTVVLIPNGIYLYDDFKTLATGRTLVFYDVRNRGRSDHVGDASQLKNGVHHDVDDLEAVRRHFDVLQPAVMGHSYVGTTVALYAKKYPDHVNRVVQLGPIQPYHGKQYPAHLTGADATLKDVLARLAALEKERPATEPTAFCRKFWSVLRVLYVANPADADKIRWERCDLPNELKAMKYFLETILPSIQGLNLRAEDFANVTMPVLTIHGTKDRSAPYGGGRDWALMLPNARLVTVENAAHAPWVEAPERVFGSLDAFLDGAWPEAAEKVTALDPRDGLTTPV